MSNSDSARYYANAIGVVAFFAFAALGIKSCSEMAQQQEKTKQIEIINKNKK